MTYVGGCVFIGTCRLIETLAGRQNMLKVYVFASSFVRVEESRRTYARVYILAGLVLQPETEHAVFAGPKNKYT